MNMTKEKVMYILEKLFSGQVIEYNITPKIKHRMILRNDRLMLISINDIQLNDTYLTCDITLNNFIELCNKIVK